MGYEVHIRRDESGSISLEEWSAYVDQADDLRMDDFAESTTPDGATIRIEEPGIAVWTAAPDPAQGGWTGGLSGCRSRPRRSSSTGASRSR